jgi:hypothetical protein
MPRMGNERERERGEARSAGWLSFRREVGSGVSKYGVLLNLAT